MKAGRMKSTPPGARRTPEGISPAPGAADVIAGPRATAGKPRKVSTNLQPVATDPQLVTTELQPVATDPEPVTSDLQPVATAPQLVTTGLQPVATDPQAVTTDPQLVATDPQLVATGYGGQFQYQQVTMQALPEVARDQLRAGSQSQWTETGAFRPPTHSEKSPRPFRNL